MGGLIRPITPRLNLYARSIRLAQILIEAEVPVEGALDTVVLVLTAIFALASVLVPDIVKDNARKRRSILIVMAFLLVGLTVWQQVSVAGQKRLAEEQRKAEVDALNAQVDSLSKQVASLETNLKIARDVANSLAPTEPVIGRGGIAPSGSYGADGLTVVYRLQNRGQLSARGISTYSETRFEDRTESPDLRLQIFNGLASRIGQLRKANQGVTFSGELPFLGDLPLSASSGSLSSPDLDALKVGHKSLYVMLYVDYKSSRGDPLVGIFCDSWGGDPAHPRSCPGNALDYYAIIRERSMPGP
jgi:hypothetical protein